jgi:hypothetical protein
LGGSLLVHLPFDAGSRSGNGRSSIDLFNVRQVARPPKLLQAASVITCDKDDANGTGFLLGIHAGVEIKNGFTATSVCWRLLSRFVD